MRLLKFLFTLLVLALLSCNNASEVKSGNSDSISRNVASAQPAHPPTLFFDVMYVDISLLNRYNANIIFQLENVKEGSKGDPSKRHEYVLFGGTYVKNTFDPKPALAKPSLNNEKPVEIGKEGEGIDLKFGNYQLKYNKDSLPTEAAYMILTPTNSQYENYVSYKISYCDTKFNLLTGINQNKEYILPLNPSPPAPPPF